MRRRKNKRLLSIKSIIYITSIAILNFIGVSYGVWSDHLNLDFATSTGNINPQFYLGSQKIVEDEDGELELTLSNDKSTLTIDGWCYPGFNENIFIDIENYGSIPVQLSRIDKANDDEIVRQLSTMEKNFIEPSEAENFKIHIQSKRDNSNSKIEADDIQGLIDQLETYNTSEIHTFKYKLEFEQGIN